MPDCQNVPRAIGDCHRKPLRIESPNCRLDNRIDLVGRKSRGVVGRIAEIIRQYFEIGAERPIGIVHALTRTWAGRAWLARTGRKAVARIRHRSRADGSKVRL